MKTFNKMKITQLMKPANILIILLFMVSSCEGLLEIEADLTVSGNIYTDSENIEKALLGAYYSLGGIADGSDGGELFGGDFAIITTLLARENSLEIFWGSTQAPAYSDSINKDILATNQRVASNWRRGYEVINVTNNIIANIENVDANDRNRIHGEALAMRGILYFEMVRLWAPQYDADGVNPDSDLAIPIVTTPLTEVDQIEKATLRTIDEVYSQAETDLAEASTLLESFDKNGTNLSYYACEVYLARIGLQKSDFDMALTHSENVINGGEYSLTASPLDAFNNLSNSSEDIFAVQQTLANSSGDRSTGTGITAHYSSFTESGLGSFTILGAAHNSSFLINSPHFEPNDARGTVDFDVDVNTPSGLVTTAYYQHVLNTGVGFYSPSKYKRADHVLPILRFAEMYLTRAEALYELSGLNSTSIDDLNRIRTRAGISALQMSDFDISANPDQFFDSLSIERKREFMYEGQLLHDLRRWGGFIGIEFNPDDPWDPKFILPIPQNEQDVSDLNGG